MTIKVGDRFIWGPKDHATVDLIDPLLDDKGVGTEDIEGAKEAREAVHKYCELHIKEFNDLSDTPCKMDELEEVILPFVQGYLSCKTGRIQRI